jgi:osmotically-inducible protein OsmY
VFEVADQPLDDIVQALKGALTEREQRNTEEVRRALAMRAAAARVKAGIATNPAFFVPVLDVETEGDGIVFRGVVHSAREHKRIEEEAKRLAGHLPIRCELHYRS